MNPLLDLSGLPRFEAFKPEYVTPAIDELLASQPGNSRNDLRLLRQRRTGTISSLRLRMQVSGSTAPGDRLIT